mgnify:CR=1 FL=1
MLDEIEEIDEDLAQLDADLDNIDDLDNLDNLDKTGDISKSDNELEDADINKIDELMDDELNEINSIDDNAVFDKLDEPVDIKSIDSEPEPEPELNDSRGMDNDLIADDLTELAKAAKKYEAEANTEAALNIYERILKLTELQGLATLHDKIQEKISILKTEIKKKLDF